MKKSILVLCLLAFMGNMAVAQYRLTPSTIDTTLLQPKSFFQKDSSNVQGNNALSAGYHLQSAGVNLMSSVIIGVIGGILTGVLAYSSFDGGLSSQTAREREIAAMVSGGVTTIATLSLVVSAGNHLNKAGKIIDGQVSD